MMSLHPIENKKRRVNFITIYNNMKTVDILWSAYIITAPTLTLDRMFRS